MELNWINWVTLVFWILCSLVQIGTEKSGGWRVAGLLINAALAAGLLWRG